MMYPLYYKRPYKHYYSNNYKNFKNTCPPPIPNLSIPECDKNSKCKDNEIKYFEILNFKLYYDDLIIIGLILLLFNEGITDQFLIIALVLLIGD